MKSEDCRFNHQSFMGSDMTEEEKTRRKEIAAGKTLKKIMADHFYELDEAAKSGSGKIAWCTSVGPAELLRGMGFLVYFPEEHDRSADD